MTLVIFSRFGFVIRALTLVTLIVVLLWSPSRAFAYEVNKSAIVLLLAKSPTGRVIATGSGFIVKPDGTLITNYHVLVDAASVEAVRLDGSRVPVEWIVKIDRIKDFAILKLRGDAYSTLEIGDSSALKEYDYTSALGYLSQMMSMEKGNERGRILQTYGIMLGQHPQADPGFSFLYTAAEFGQGFSGGPLVNRDNQVIGIATVEGRSINLALPINYVKPFLNGKDRISFARLLEEDRKSKEAGYYRGNYALYVKGDPDEAIRHFRKVLDEDPKFVLAYFDLAAAYREKGMLEKVIESYEKALEINPDFPEVLSNLGGYYFRAGKIEKAAALLKHAIEVYPNFIQALSNLGAALNKLGRSREALPYLRKTLSLDPEFAIGYFNLGNAHFALNQLDPAEKAYGRAVKLGVDFLSLHWKLYGIHHRKGRKREAAEQLKIILQIDPQNQEAREKLLAISPLQ